MEIVYEDLHLQPVKEEAESDLGEEEEALRAGEHPEGDATDGRLQLEPGDDDGELAADGHLVAELLPPPPPTEPPRLEDRTGTAARHRTRQGEDPCAGGGAE